MERVWPGRIVEENAIQVHVSALRKAGTLLKTADVTGSTPAPDSPRPETVGASITIFWRWKASTNSAVIVPMRKMT